MMSQVLHLHLSLISWKMYQQLPVPSGIEGTLNESTLLLYEFSCIIRSTLKRESPRQKKYLVSEYEIPFQIITKGYLFKKCIKYLCIFFTPLSDMSANNASFILVAPLLIILSYMIHRFLSEKNLLWQRTCPSLAWLMPSR